MVYSSRGLDVYKLFTVSVLAFRAEQRNGLGSMSANCGAMARALNRGE
jgi:hypothetical protein